MNLNQVLKCVTGATLFAALTASAQPASADPDTKNKRPITLTVIHLAQQLGITVPGRVDRIPDVPPQVPGPGAYPFGVSNLIYSQLALPSSTPNQPPQIIGSVHNTCVFSGTQIQLNGAQGRNAQLCTYVFVFNGATPEQPASQITAQGVFDQIGYDTGVPQYLAITGGTGVFATSQGQIKVTFMAPTVITLQ